MALAVPESTTCRLYPARPVSRAAAIRVAPVAASSRPFAARARRSTSLIPPRPLVARPGDVIDRPSPLLIGEVVGKVRRARQKSFALTVRDVTHT